MTITTASPTTSWILLHSHVSKPKKDIAKPLKTIEHSINDDESDWIVVGRGKSEARASQPECTPPHNQDMHASKQQSGLRREMAYASFKPSDIIPFRPAPEGPPRPGQLCSIEDDAMELDSDLSTIINYGDAKRK